MLVILSLCMCIYYYCHQDSFATHVVFVRAALDCLPLWRELIIEYSLSLSQDSMSDASGAVLLSLSLFLSFFLAYWFFLFHLFFSFLFFLPSFLFYLLLFVFFVGDGGEWLYVCMCAMYVCMYICMYVRRYACTCYIIGTLRFFFNYMFILLIWGVQSCKYQDQVLVCQ